MPLDATKALEDSVAVEKQPLEADSGYVGHQLKPTRQIDISEETINVSDQDQSDYEIVNVTYQQGISYSDDDTQVAAISAEFEIIRNGVPETVYGEVEVVSRATIRKPEGGVAEFVGDVVGDVFEIAFDALKRAVNIAIDVLQAVQPFLKYLNFITPFIPAITPLKFFNFLEFGMPFFWNLLIFRNTFLNDVIFFLDDLIPVFPSG